MDARTTAGVLAQIASYLELRGANRFKATAYERAARAVASLATDDLRPLLESGALAATPGIGPATMAVVEDLVRTGRSSYLERLRDEMPEGMLAMLRVPGLSIAQIHKIHDALGVASVTELEAAAQDGRLATLPRFTQKTADRILAGIAQMRERGSRRRIADALREAEHLAALLAAHAQVARVELAGALRRGHEIVDCIDLVAGVRASGSPAQVAADLATMPGVAEAAFADDGCTVTLRFADDARCRVHCVPDATMVRAVWRCTGSDDHVSQVETRLAAHAAASRGVDDEAALYRLAGLAYVAPELRESGDEVEHAAAGTLPVLVTRADIRGVLHCHSTYSDGKASIREMAEAARARGWSYLGISDHSQAAFYAGGLKPDQVLEQHAEIDRLNAELAPTGFRVLKGIEADILADGRLDYDDALLARFDYVIGSVHSRFKMTEREMTDRVLAALDSPYLTVLAHPTGRLLLSREPYAIDLHAVLDRAAARGVAVEINADPHRLDLDWRHVRGALARGITIEIGPDAHSPRGLDHIGFGITMARKGWVTAADVLNARSADEVVAFARRRREG